MEEQNETDECLKVLFNVDNGEDTINQKSISYDSASLGMYKSIERLERLYRTSDVETEPILGFDYEDFQQGSLIVVSSRPAIGKTAFILSLLKKLSIDSNIPTGLILPGTMDYTSLGNRLISMMSNIPLTKINCCRLSTDEVTKIQEVADDIYHKPFLVINEPNCSLDFLLSSAKLLVKEQKIKILVIDDIEYLEEIVDSNEKEYRLVLNKVLDEIKNLSEEINIPIVLTITIPFRDDNNEPTIQDFKKYLTILKKTDKLMFIHRERTLDTENHVEQAKIIIAKNELGHTGDIELEFNNQTVFYYHNNMEK